MEKRKILFEERQFLGLNHYSMLRSLVLSLFCFMAYYYTENREKNADLLFLAGVMLLIISVLSIFILHLHTSIYETCVELDGLWTTKKVKIDLASIAAAEIVPYSNYMLNSPVYNLHHKGVIKFYTSGKSAVKLTDKDGMNYLIGTHKQEEFLRIVSGLINR
jgi:hypothetical protein